MKFLVDAQLPPQLARWLVARGHVAEHVGELADGLRMPDAAIWHHARVASRVIVTKDGDFLDLAAVEGAPPIVLHVALGNTSTRDLLETLHAAWPALAQELERPDAAVVTVERDRLVVLRGG